MTFNYVYVQLVIAVHVLWQLWSKLQVSFMNIMNEPVVASII